ncbi:parallel beta helix pectate lyase-like protein [Tahibacter aquaticus]|uniref:Parallel beta helix pectate lyase-like protein n=1 Tax=Tahibacter aquaticus TaxID=520092 RepID=A0A4R6Z2K1_9GAMM|nr:right-handed parallel beta-helix repeat-containing protein [Tahibacter aquaticus]TDR45827.1 parallel beta helix pectate lyase-like protein [Tahibacter aquaticus]
MGTTRDDVVVESSATRLISIESNTTLQNFTLQPTSGHLPEFGVFSYYQSAQTVWGLRLKGSLINLASVGSSDVNVWDTYMSDNGGSPSADPNVWITDSTDMEFPWGAVYGEVYHPWGGGDGEIAAYNSTNVRIYGTQVIDSGASAIYLVNCDSCSVENATLLRAAGWGLDVVQGSDNFTAINNLVQQSQYGGSVFDQLYQTGGTYTGNTFIGNNTGGNANCNAINVAGNPAALTLSGNTATPAPLTCVY